MQNARTMIYCWVGLCSIGFLSQACGDDDKTKKEKERVPIPIFITPIYDSNGLKIEVGPFSEKLKRADAKTILDVTKEIRGKKEALRPEVMYVTAIRLYDLGQKDEAVYWFYMAQYRARLFVSILDSDKMGSIGSEPFEAKQAYNAFNQLAGVYINGYAFGHLEKLEKTLVAVIEDGKAIPKFREIYPKVSFVSPVNWNVANRNVADGLGKLIEYIKSDADMIKAARKKNGIEGKY